MAIFVKDPAATVDYAIDWNAGYLEAQGIATSFWRVLPGGDEAVIVEASRIDAGRTVATLRGGLAGTVHHIINTVRFSDDRIDERTLVLRVEER